MVQARAGQLRIGTHESNATLLCVECDDLFNNDGCKIQNKLI
jgi:hypothetical protein